MQVWRFLARLAFDVSHKDINRELLHILNPYTCERKMGQRVACYNLFARTAPRALTSFPMPNGKPYGSGVLPSVRLVPLLAYPHDPGTSPRRATSVCMNETPSAAPGVESVPWIWGGTLTGSVRRRRTVKRYRPSQTPTTPRMPLHVHPKAPMDSGVASS